MEAIFSIAGSIASVFAAIWAVTQAKRSSQYATEAQKVRDDLIARRQLVEISQVNVETQRILSALSDVGPTCTATSVKGLNSNDIARQVEEYVRFLNEQRGHFSEKLVNRATDLCRDLRPEIEKLSQAQDFDSIRSSGRALYYMILDFQPIAKELTDNTRERRP